MKNSTATRQQRIDAIRAEFEKHIEYLADIEEAVGHEPGFAATIVMGSAPICARQTSFRSRSSIKDPGGIDMEPLRDAEIPNVAWELAEIIGCLEVASLQKKLVAARRVEMVLRRHREKLAA